MSFRCFPGCLASIHCPSCPSIHGISGDVLRCLALSSLVRRVFCQNFSQQDRRSSPTGSSGHHPQHDSVSLAHISSGSRRCALTARLDVLTARCALPMTMDEHQRLALAGCRAKMAGGAGPGLRAFHPTGRTIEDSEAGAATDRASHRISSTFVLVVIEHSWRNDSQTACQAIPKKQERERLRDVEKTARVSHVTKHAARSCIVLHRFLRASLGPRRVKPFEI